MLVYREETSTGAMMVSGGRVVGRDRIISRKWLVSWTWERRDLTNCLEVGLDVGRDAFSRGTIGNDGVPGVAWFVYLRK